MHGLGVIEGMTMSGHPWIINEDDNNFDRTEDRATVLKMNGL